MDMTRYDGKYHARVRKTVPRVNYNAKNGTQGGKIPQSTQERKDQNFFLNVVTRCAMAI